MGFSFLPFGYATSRALFSKGEFGGRAIYVTLCLCGGERQKQREKAANGFVPLTKAPDPQKVGLRN